MSWKDAAYKRKIFIRKVIMYFKVEFYILTSYYFKALYFNALYFSVILNFYIWTLFQNSAFWLESIWTFIIINHAFNFNLGKFFHCSFLWKPWVLKQRRTVKKYSLKNMRYALAEITGNSVDMDNMDNLKGKERHFIWQIYRFFVKYHTMLSLLHSFLHRQTWKNYKSTSYPSRYGLNSRANKKKLWIQNQLE